MIEAINTANLYSTKLSSLSQTVNNTSLDSIRSDILTLTSVCQTMSAMFSSGDVFWMFNWTMVDGSNFMTRGI